MNLNIIKNILDKDLYNLLNDNIHEKYLIYDIFKFYNNKKIINDEIKNLKNNKNNEYSVNYRYIYNSFYYNRCNSMCISHNKIDNIQDYLYEKSFGENVLNRPNINSITNYFVYISTGGLNTYINNPKKIHELYNKVYDE